MKTQNRVINVLLCAFTLPVAAVIMAMYNPGDEIPARPKGPGDIYAAAGTPAVTAHSTTRALYAAYNGPLYQVMRHSDGTRLNIGIVQPSKGDAGGYANAAAQDAFCAGSLCSITIVYDQSGKGNHLTQAPPGTFKGPEKGMYNTLPIADMAPVTINGHKAYGVFIMPGMGLRNNNARDLAINDEPEGIYYVINGKHFDSGCCFDYGNSSTNSRAVGTGTMETTYYGTSTAWGSGNGAGPWIMTDLEAGLFSGFNAKKNNVESIDSWQFVTAVMDGGGGNKWDLRGGDAQKGKLTTYYNGVRPGTPGSNAYFPMNKKGAVLLGNGGDNGNGSAGTFYEGIMTVGYPTEATTDAVQANIVAGNYDVPSLNMSRITTFAPGASQDVTVKFTNTTGTTAKGVALALTNPKGWVVSIPGFTGITKKFVDPIPAGATVSVTFKVTSPAIKDGGFIQAVASWTGASGLKSEKISQRIRNVPAVKINEVRFGTGNNASNQFIELYNASTKTVDVSGWKIISTPSGWAPVKLATLPAGTKIAAKGFYLLGLSTTGTLAPAAAGSNTLNVHSIAGLATGQSISINGEANTIAAVGTAALPAFTIYIPVSTSARLIFPIGTTTLPVSSAAGFKTGEKIGIDLGGKYEVATVTAVGKAATQANLSVAAKAGDNIIKVTDNANITAGDVLSINTGVRKENVKVKRVVNLYTAPARGGTPGAGGDVELEAPLKLNHMTDVDVYAPGTGIRFSPATRFVHQSGDAVQALGSGIQLQNKLNKSHAPGEPLISTQVNVAGYQGAQLPNQWFGYPLSAAAGSIELTDASGSLLVDGIVYGSQQSNSSANGTIASPHVATLEGEQGQGGCIVVLPNSSARGPIATSANDQTDRSIGRYPDGNDSDSNCGDFMLQNVITLAAPATQGNNNIKVAGVANFNAGQKVTIGSGANSENAVIASVGTPGASKTTGVTAQGAKAISVNSVAGFTAGQSITIGSGSEQETTTISSIAAARRRFGAANTAGSPTDSIMITVPLKNSHGADAIVAGSGITLTAPLGKSHESGTQVTSAPPTPGLPNQYTRKQ